MRRAVWSVQLLRKRTALAFLLLAPCALLHSTPPPELTVLRTQYDKVVAERVTAPFEAALSALNTKFTGALDNASAEAKKAGSLPAVLAIEADKKRIADKLPLPDEDDEQTPDSLKKLRAIYREQFKKLDDQRVANHQTILPAYTAKLQALEATLTKADRVEEAKDVMDYRVSLKAGAPSAVAAVTTAPSATASTVSAHVKPARSFPPADDRKVAQWALDYAWRINIKVAGEERDRSLSKDKDSMVPDAPFVIDGIDMNLQVPPKKPFKHLETLAGLQSVRWLNLYNMDISDADCDIFASMPKLETLGFSKNRGRLTGSRFDVLASSPAFKSLDLRGCPITSNGLKGVAALGKLETLTLTDTETSDNDLAHLATMTSLQSLKLDLTKVTIKGLPALKPLVNLTGFGWSPSPKKAKAELAELAAILPGIVSFQLRTKGDISADDAAGLAAFPKLEKLYLEYETCSKAVLTGLSTLPAFKYLRCYYGDNTTDDAFEALSQSSTLEVVDFDNMPRLTGAVLAHLGKIPNLKKIALSRCDKIDKASIDAFKTAHPQVSINK